MSEDKMDTDKIYDVLKSRIINLDYAPGQVLNEVDIASEFSTSRTPIRRVFQLLCTDKLLNIIPRFGAQVAPIDFKQMKAIFEVTRELDPFAARLAIERISEENLGELEKIVMRLKSYDIKTDYQKAISDDEKFHDIVYSSCGNPWLSDILTGLHHHTERLWHYSEHYFDTMDLFTHTLGELYQAIKDKDVAKAEKYAREHIDEFVAKIRKEML